jgi:hypothetical protein
MHDKLNDCRRLRHTNCRRSCNSPSSEDGSDHIIPYPDHVIPDGDGVAQSGCGSEGSGR